jgi:LysM repeat protein
MVFHQGDVVYLEQLRKRNWKAKKYITVGGETVRDIALRFAVRPDKILKRNHLEPNVVLKPGQKIKLR